MSLRRQDLSGVVDLVGTCVGFVEEGGGHGGGGATHSLGVGTNCETTAPTFLQWTAPGLTMSKFTASSFQGTPRTTP